LGLIRKYPVYPEMYHYLEMAQCKQKDYEEAFSYFSNALDLFLDNIKAQKALVKVSRLRNKFFN